MIAVDIRASRNNETDRVKFVFHSPLSDLFARQHFVAGLVDDEDEEKNDTVQAGCRSV